MNTFNVSDIEDIVHHVFGKVVSCFSNDDTLVIEKVHQNIRIVYSSKRASSQPPDLTWMELHLCLDTEEMWIGSLRVAVPFRLIGIGRQLVKAAEEVASAIEFGTINVLPIRSSQSFWLKMGYRSHRCTAHVLSKSVNPHCYVQTLALTNPLEVMDCTKMIG